MSDAPHSAGPPGVVFVFSGHGAQWPGMARELLDTSPLFARHIEACERALEPHLRWSLTDVLRGKPRARRLQRVNVVQPALFAVTVSLAHLWRACGVEPEAVMGHSQGELAAAHFAGALSLEDAAMVIARRSRLLAELSGKGAMAAIAGPREWVHEQIDSLGSLDVGAINGPDSLAVGGPLADVEELLRRCKAHDLRAGKVAIDYASHSRQIEPLRERMLAALADVAPRTTELPFYSTLTGGRFQGGGCDVHHWYRTERGTVEFERATREILADGLTAFLEISPHPVLAGAMQETVDHARGGGADVLVSSALRRGQDSPLRLWNALAELSAHGLAVDWEGAQAVLGSTRPTAGEGASEPRLSSGTPAASRRGEGHEQGLQGSSSSPPAQADTLAGRIEGQSQSERERIALDLLGAQLAAVLGLCAFDRSMAQRPFKELGLDSSGAVELRNRLRAITGLPIPATLIFDHPNPTALARGLLDLVRGGDPHTAFATPTANFASPRAGASPEEPIAIVGMSCRFPGGINTPQELWDLVLDGRDAIGDFPSDRGWDLDGLYDTDPDRSGTSYSRQGGFLHDAADFDAGFFNISPREALAMDPQQRLFLEVCWEAFEHAGLTRESVAESQTGVFAGINTLDYNARAWLAPDGLEGHNMTGAIGSVIAGRVSYVFGLQGPSLTVDTACSSSLVATHLACSALRREECSMALAGGVSVMVSPGLFVAFSRQRALAADGRCKSFARAADGTSWGEGVGVLLLERLADAQRHGHRVIAVVRGSAVNQDGASNGLAAPNGLAQQQVIRRALATAGLSPQQIDVVEAHGTGTRLGDPIEANALLAAYGQGRPPGRPLWLGSIKSNIGHTQAVGGVAGAIKMAMALRHGVMPRTLHLGEPSHEVNWSTGDVALLSEAVDWPAGEEPRRAAVSSYGISGTNVHMIFEQAPPEPATSTSGDTPSPSPRPVAWVLSGRSAQALKAQAARLAAFAAQEEPRPQDVGQSLAHRTAFEHRAAIVGEDLDGLREGAWALARGELAPGLTQGLGPNSSARLAFLFTGQGAQRVGMGAELYRSLPVFAAAFDEVCLHMDELLGRSLREVVFDSSAEPEVEARGLLDETMFTQAGLFALEVALYRLLQAWGLEADFLIGHSIGELVGAFLANVYSLEDACRLVAARGRLMGELPPGGAMVAIQASELELAETLAGLDGRVALAGINGPRSVVISGESEPVLRVASLWRERGRKTKSLRVSHAFHSPLMEGMLEDFRRVAETVSFDRPSIPLVSNLTGEPLSEELCTAEYWVRQVRSPVRFAEGVAWLRTQGVANFLELGPDGALSAMVQECLAEIPLPEDEASVHEGADLGSPAQSSVAVQVGPVLRRGRSEVSTLLEALAGIWTNGADVDWVECYRGSGAQPLELPTYAFQRERFWLEPSTHAAGDVAATGQTPVGHPLLGAAVALADNGGWLFTGRLSSQAQPWLTDHAILGKVLLPGTAFLELALHAGDQLGCPIVGELTLQSPLVLPDEAAVQLQLSLDAAEETGARAFTIYSRPEHGTDEGSKAEWLCHGSGSLIPARADRAGRHGIGSPAEEEAWPPNAAEEVPLEDFYESLIEQGLDYGPVFRGLRKAWRKDGELFAEAALPDTEVDRAQAFGLHPALLDAALQATILTRPSASNAEGSPEDVPPGEQVWLPFCFSDVELLEHGACTLRVRFSPTEGDSLRIAAVDERGRRLASVGALVLRSVSAAGIAGASAGHDGLFQLDWKPLANRGGQAKTKPSQWALVGLADRDGPPDAGLDASLVEDLGGTYADMSSLLTDMASGGEVPRQVLLDCTGVASELPNGAHRALRGTLGALQECLADERLAESRLILLTRGAVAIGPGKDVADLSGAAIWGLARCAQSENPQRVVLIDRDRVTLGEQELAAALASGEPQVAIRDGRPLLPRLARSGEDGALVPPPGDGAWRVGESPDNTFEGLSLVASPEADRPLEPGEVRVRLRAAGVNFKDVLIALGVYPGAATIGNEAAGIVLEVGSAVAGIAPGDRVMGLFPGAFGPVAIADRRLLAQMPEGWSFAQAASMPLVFLTAYYALVNLADVRPHERLLVHAASGGVGTAAVQLARHLGVEVFATASPAKWSALEAMGIDASHIASSRELSFKERFLGETGGGGVDVVLNSLAGDFVDASLDLLGRGGRFVEMGKTDVRDPVEIAARRAGVSYKAFDLMDAGPVRIEQMFEVLTDLFERGELTLPPVRAWDVRRAPEALRFMSQARHVGKLVLTIPASAIDPDGTVLITGGTGGLGSVLARHLVSEHGIRNLLLASRSGEQAPGIAELAEDLTALGANVVVASCDVSQREQLRALIDSIPEHRPLRAVVHAAGLLDDGLVQSLTPERIDRVLAPKLDAAWHLHELTEHMDLDAFVLFSSVAATLGWSGQGNYAAANSFLDALATHRRSRGLPAVAMAWGPWEQTVGMTSSLGASDLARMATSGMLTLTHAKALELFDLAWSVDRGSVVLARLDVSALRARARTEDLPSLFDGFVRRPTREQTAETTVSASLRERLLGTASSESGRIVGEFVLSQTAMVLGHASAEAIDATMSFADLGFDSLASVELRNRLGASTGMQLPVTLVFDHPTPGALGAHLHSVLSSQADQPDASAPSDIEELLEKLSAISAERALESGTASRLREILSGWTAPEELRDADFRDEEISSAADEEIFELIDREFGVS